MKENLCYSINKKQTMAESSSILSLYMHHPIYIIMMQTQLVNNADYTIERKSSAPKSHAGTNYVCTFHILREIEDSYFRIRLYLMFIRRLEVKLLDEIRMALLIMYLLSFIDICSASALLSCFVYCSVQ